MNITLVFASKIVTLPVSPCWPFAHTHSAVLSMHNLASINYQVVGGTEFGLDGTAKTTLFICIFERLLVLVYPLES